jgi:hypothetical protein
MKVRYERGALADLEEIFEYMLKTIPGRPLVLSPASRAPQRALAMLLSLARRRAMLNSGVYRQMTI